MKLKVFIVLITTIFSVNAQSLNTLNIGVQSYAPPFSIQVDKKKHFTGFEAQLIATVCKRLQIDCIFHPLEAEFFFTQLLTHKIDLAIGEIDITLAREKQFIFSISYMISNGEFITKNSSPITTVEAIKGKKLVYSRALFTEPI